MSGVQLDLFSSESTSCAADSLARTSVPQVVAPDSPESVPASGTSICASCGSSNPAPSSSKMSRRARRAGSFQCAECLRLAAIERVPSAYLQAMSERPTCDEGSSCSHWPTPTVEGGNNRAGLSQKSGDGLNTAIKKWGPRLPTNADWVECLMGFPTGWTRTDGQPARANSNTTTSRREPSKRARTRKGESG